MAATKPQPLPMGRPGGKPRSQQGCAASATQTLSPHPFSLAARAVEPTSHAAASQKARVKGQPQHSPASEPMITHTRITGSTTFAASAKERIHSLCSQTEFNPLHTPSEQRTCCWAVTLGAGTWRHWARGCGFWGYFPCFFSQASGRKPHLL